MKSIILVEDDFIISLLLEKQILHMGYKVSSKVDNAISAIEKVKNEHPDLVLMDIKLAGEMDGIEAMTHIRRFSNIPVIYLTGNGDDNTRQRAQSTHPGAYLVKPVDMEALKNAINGILDNAAELH